MTKRSIEPATRDATYAATITATHTATHAAAIALKRAHAGLLGYFLFGARGSID